MSSSIRFRLGRDRLSLLVNRLNRRHELSPEDMEKVFNFPISAGFPRVRRHLLQGQPVISVDTKKDYGVAHRALTAGKPIPPTGDLGRALQGFGESLFVVPKSEKRGHHQPHLRHDDQQERGVGFEALGIVVAELRIRGPAG